MSDDTWYTFCDAARIAPDTLETSDVLAARYTRFTGQPMTAEQVRRLRGVSDTRIKREAARWDRLARGRQR